MLYTSKKVFVLLFLLALVLAVFSPFGSAEEANASISGIVFVDDNGNGLREEGEKGLQGAELSLVAVSSQSQRLIAQTISGADGTYRFDGLSQGDYVFQASLPSGSHFTSHTPGGSVMLPGYERQSQTPVFTLNKNEQAAMDIGTMRRSGQIKIIAFGDLNMNGGRMSNEPLLRGVQVQLIYESGGEQFIIAQGQTNKNGELVFRNLTQTVYRIAAVMPEPYIIGPIGQKINYFYNVIPPSENRTGISDPFTLERSIGLAIGGVKAGTLKGRVWLDGSMDGTLDGDEGGQAGILLTLTHLELGVTRTLTTTQDSPFTFEYLQAGEYSLRADLPEGLMFALPGSPSVFQDGYADSQSLTVYVREDGETTLDPIGVMPASSITVLAYHDSNTDGLRQENEPAYAGALVEIIDAQGVSASAKSDSQGKVVFPRVRQGEVTLRVTLGDGQVFSVPGGEHGNAFFAPSASSALSIQYDLSAGEQKTLLAGATIPGSISGALFEDSNLSGSMDSDETWLSGFSVEAVNEQGEAVAQAWTDINGSYLLEDLVPGSYQVRIHLASPYVFSEPVAAGHGIENSIVEQTAAYGQTAALTLQPGQLLEHINAGAFRSAVINGAVLLGDDILGYGGTNGGLAGVRVELLDEYGQPVSTHTNAITDDSGAFSLKGALPGAYSLLITLPNHAKFSQPLMEERSATSNTLEVKAADVLNLQPLYAVQTGIVSGTAFHDVNNNAAFDEGDMPLAGNHIILHNTLTQEIYQTMSDQQGFYLLEGIRPGPYEATVRLVPGYALDANESSLVPASIDGQATAQIDISMGARFENGLMPALQPIQVGGIIYYDEDLDGSYAAQADTPASLQVSLIHQRTGTQATLLSGNDGNLASGLMFPGLYSLRLSLPEGCLLKAPQGAQQEEGSGEWLLDLTLEEGKTRLELGLVQLGSISGAFWNMDGSSKDLKSLPVSLMDEAGVMVAETTSAADGTFSFGGLLPVSYRLSAQLPEQYRFARVVDTAQRPSVIVSDIVGMESATGQSDLFKLGMGEARINQDIGMGAMGRLGDFAWLDLDRDGMQDAGEPGLPGIVIRLYQYGKVSAQTTTDLYGRYLFDKLFPGSYTLEADMPLEVKPTIQQTEFPLVCSVLQPGNNDKTAYAKDIVVPSGGRNLNADLGFVLRKDGRYPAELDLVPVKDWTRVNEQEPKR